DHPVTLEHFGRAAGAIELSRALVDLAGSTLDRGEALAGPWSLAAKTGVPELAFAVVDGAMQRLGGRGYVEASGVPQLFRDPRLFRIFEGPTEALASHLGASAMADARAVACLLDARGRSDLARELEAHAGAIRGALRGRRLDRRG